MKIAIDTKEESKDDIKMLIKMLSAVVDDLPVSSRGLVNTVVPTESVCGTSSQSNNPFAGMFGDSTQVSNPGAVASNSAVSNILSSPTSIASQGLQSITPSSSISPSAADLLRGATSEEDDSDNEMQKPVTQESETPKIEFY